MGLVASTVVPLGLLETAGASPLDPGLGYPADLGPTAFCSSPQAVARRPGWSRVLCSVGADLFIVPPGVHVLEVDVLGASGGSGGGSSRGGGGAEIAASIMVAPGQELEMAVGGAGALETGGFNGGGDGANAAGCDPVCHGAKTGPAAAGGGGGSSDIRVGTTGPWDRVLSAAGGGGGGGSGAEASGGTGGASGMAGSAGGGGGFGGPGGSPATSAGSGPGGGSGVMGGGAGGGTALIGGPGGRVRRCRPPVVTAAGGAAATGSAAAARAVVLEQVEAAEAGAPTSSTQLSCPRGPPSHIPTEHIEATAGSWSTTTRHPIVCGQTIYASITLAQNLDCRGSSGLTIGGELQPPLPSNVVLNLGGHTIRGDLTSVGIDVAEQGPVIENGRLTGFGTSIHAQVLGGYLGQGSLDPAPTISHVTLSDGGIGLDEESSVEPVSASLDHVSITRMSDAGVMGVDGFFQITDTVITNSATGISVEGGGLTLTRDTITDNSGAGVDGVRSRVDVIDNTLNANQIGLSIVTPDDLGQSPTDLDSDVTITGNTINHNGASGIVWTGDAGDGDVVSGNVANGNGTADPPAGAGDGLQVDITNYASGITVTGNRADDNRGYGIDSVGVTDGGGNTASGNHGARPVSRGNLLTSLRRDRAPRPSPTGGTVTRPRLSASRARTLGG